MNIIDSTVIIPQYDPVIQTFTKCSARLDYQSISIRRLKEPFQYRLVIIFFLEITDEKGGRTGEAEIDTLMDFNHTSLLVNSDLYPVYFLCYVNAKKRFEERLLEDGGDLQMDWTLGKITITTLDLAQALNQMLQRDLTGYRLN